MSRTCVVVGASGGIGRALASRLLGAGDTVHALGRSAIDLPGAVLHHPVEVTDEAAVRRAAGAVGASGRVDLVVVATGILHENGNGPEKTVRSLDAEILARLFAVNAIGPALVAKHFVPLLPRTGRSAFAALSARVGSIGDNRLGGWYGYRASKAALNQILRTLAIEVRRTRPDAVVLGLHPGTVATGLSRPFRGADSEGVFDPDTAAAHLLGAIEGATAAQSGDVLDWAGRTIPP